MQNLPYNLLGMVSYKRSIRKVVVPYGPIGYGLSRIPSMHGKHQLGSLSPVKISAAATLKFEDGLSS